MVTALERTTAAVDRGDHRGPRLCFSAPSALPGTSGPVRAVQSCDFRRRHRSPLAFLLGLPFPAGLARVAREFEALIPWAWAVNGCASVAGAVLAALLAVHLGFTVVVILAVILYLLALGAAFSVPGEKTS